MAEPIKVKDWSILRIRNSEDEVEYRIFGDSTNGVYLSNALVSIDKMSAEAECKKKSYELVDDSVATKDSEHYETLVSYCEGRGWQWTDMTDSITTRTFLPPSSYAPDPVEAKEDEAVEVETAEIPQAA